MPNHNDLKAFIRTIPNFPKPGVMFRDISTLVRDAQGFPLAIEHLAALVEDLDFSLIAGIEARGFIFGAALAQRLRKGFLMVRKKDKLPGPTLGINYSLEYRVDRIEIHADALNGHDRVLVVDDLIATGGTALATIKLIETVGAQVVAAAFLIDLPELSGSNLLREHGVPVRTLLEFPGT
jgi:adenine phosphoribosyltransferase